MALLDIVLKILKEDCPRIIAERFGFLKKQNISAKPVTYAILQT
jgi:hypothetical protein